jgi:hypothetical protein
MIWAILVDNWIVSVTTAKSGAGLGSGYVLSGRSLVRSITLSESVITAAGSSTRPSIGAPHLRSAVDSLQFLGRNIVNSTSTGAVPQVNASSILLCNASVVFVASAMPVFGSDPTNIGLYDLVIFYCQATPALRNGFRG